MRARAETLRGLRDGRWQREASDAGHGAVQQQRANSSGKVVPKATSPHKAGDWTEGNSGSGSRVGPCGLLSSGGEYRVLVGRYLEQRAGGEQAAAVETEMRETAKGETGD